QGVGRLGARVRRRLGLLGRACVGRAGARRRRRPGALDVPLRPLRRALRRPAPRRAHARGAALPRGVRRRLPARGHGSRRGAQLWVPSCGRDRDDIPELEAAVAAAREEGIADLWTWGYEACRHMTHLATPDGPLVWDAVRAALTSRPQTVTTEAARADLTDL